MSGGDLEFYDEEDGGTHRFLSFPEFQVAFRHPRTREMQDGRNLAGENPRLGRERL